MRDDPLRDCPACGEPELRRLITGGAGVIFKGNGFYVTDSRKGTSASGSTGNGRESSATRETAGSGSSGESKTPESTSTSSTASGSTDSGGSGKKDGTTRKSA